MKITLVGPGLMPIPPKGWGAVEILIADHAAMLKAAGHQVTIVNQLDRTLALAEVAASQPDLVHLHYDEYIGWAEFITCARIVATSHYAYLEVFSQWKSLFQAPLLVSALRLARRLFPARLLLALGFSRPLLSALSYEPYFRAFLRSRCGLICLSPSIAEVYRQFGFQGDIRVCPNGARDDLIRYSPTPSYPDLSLCVGKIEPRKRQAQLASLPDLRFVGPIVDPRFPADHPGYLGPWSREQLFIQLTQYGNLVLLSDGEAHPLVCCEALIAGLGLVVSEPAAANLDRSLPFISVIPDAVLQDRKVVARAIRRNRQQCQQVGRDVIRAYGLRAFALSTWVQRYPPLLQEPS
jgi:hypothetical protein